MRCAMGLKNSTANHEKQPSETKQRAHPLKDSTNSKSPSTVCSPQPSPQSPPRSFALTVAYDGTHYSGWQVQPGQRTIQGELEKAVASLAGYQPGEVGHRILGSGRTDAGVHAVGQVARCVMPRWRSSPAALLKAINAKLPGDIAVRSVRETIERFHPIADAIAKRYRYQIQFGGGRDPFAYRTWHREVLSHDMGLLQNAADKFVGTHDFAAFQASGAQRNTTVRTISHSRWRPVESESSTQRWIYEVEGNGFLYNMVRNLVGTMLEVSRGKQPLAWIDSVIASKDRKLAGPTAPPHGLFLCRVDYSNELFLAAE